MKKFYYIVDTEENNKCYAYVAVIHENTNLKKDHTFLKNDVRSITPCSTLKEARVIAEAWNLMYINAGIYLFDDEPLF